MRQAAPDHSCNAATPHLEGIDAVLRFLQACAGQSAVALDGLNPLPGNKQVDDISGNVVTGPRCKSGGKRLARQSYRSSGAVGTVAYTRLEDRTDAGQLFNRDLNFTIPVREAVRIALDVKPRQPVVLIAPSQEESGLIRSEVEAATGSGLLFLGSLSALAWPAAPRGRPREGGVVGLPEFRSKNQ